MSGAPADTCNVEQWSGKDRADENFPVGSLLIRPALRAHVHAFYEFARNADDIADAPDLTAEDKISRLDRMEQVLLGTSADGSPSSGSPSSGSPSAARLRESLAQCGVTSRHATDLLIAFRQDAVKTRYASWDELYDYCVHSAMPVGRHVLDLHGESPDTWPASDALCAVLQVLNHLQDCAKDLATLDRCYLPDEMLARHGASLDDLRGAAESAGLRATFSELLDRCDQLNTQARALPRLVRARRLRLECAVIVGLCQRLAARLRAEDPIAGRVKLHKRDAIGAALGALRFLP